MNKPLTILLGASLCVCMVLSSAAYSTTSDATAQQFISECRVEAPRAGDLVTGQWYHGLDRVRAYAEEKGLPLVSVWSNSGCDHCEKLEKNFLTKEFKKLMKDSGYLYCFTWSKDGDGAKRDDVYMWNSQNLKITSFPFVRFYWKSIDGVGGIDEVAIGDTVDGAKVDGTATFNYIKNVFKNYVPYVPPAYAAGSFVNGASAADRLEARTDTEWVDVPLKREGAGVAQPTNETLKAAFPGVKAAVEYPVAWAANESNKTVRVGLRPEGFVFTVGKKVELTLNSDGRTSPAAYVALVEEPENNPKNPLWIGTRDADALKAGEWTMDLKVAKARAEKRNAPVLALVGGSLWCPDCVKVDHYLIDTPKFRTWISDHDVSCVAIDIPNIASGKTTSLLTYDPYEVSERYITATTPNQEKVQSGAGYLSRNMIEPEAAKEIAGRNYTLVTTSVTEGGLCRPENMDGDNAETGPFKTGIPCLILMRPDGTVAGRIFQFNNVSPGDTTALDAYLARMDELLALVSEAAEESNADWRTTKEEVGLIGRVEGATVSAVDLADVYRLEAPAFTAKGTVSLKSLTAKPGSGTKDYKKMATENNVKLSLLKVKSGAATTVQTKTGNVFTGVSFDVTLAPDPDAEWFVEVRALGTVDAGSSLPSKTFALERKDGSTVKYALDTALKYEASTIGFEKKSVSVNENTAGTVTVKVLRQDATTGTAEATVVFDEAATTALPGSFSYVIDGEADCASRKLTWADGDASARTISITIPNDTVYDGDRTIAFRLEGIDGSPLKAYAGTTALTVTVKEDDKAVVGKLAITETVPAMTSAMKVFALEGTTLDIGIERINGAAKPFGAKLTASAGVLSSNRVDWVNNDRVPLKHVELKLPLVKDAPQNGVITVTLTPDKGIAAVSAKKKLTVQLIAADVPRFAVETLSLDLFRYTMAEKTLAIENTQGGTLSVKKLSGSLPAGVTVKIGADKASLSVSGAPTAAKVCEAVYQVTEKRGKTTVLGGIVKLTFNAVDPAKGGGPDGKPLNPSVAKARTFTDLMVIDPETKCLTGLLTITIPANGKVSAKYKCSGGTVSLSASGWAACDGKTGLLRAELTVKNKPYAASVCAGADGSVSYELTDPVYENKVCGLAEATAWDKNDPAKDFMGFFTVDLPVREVLTGADVASTGDAWLTLKMNTTSAANSGTMTYSGCLPNGQAFSGSGKLVRRVSEDGVVTAVLPVYYRTAKNCFTGAPEILAGAAEALESSDYHRTVGMPDDVRPYWYHTEPKTEDACYGIEYDLYGAAYDAAEDIGGCARRSDRYDNAPLYFSAADAVEPLEIALAKTGISIAKGVQNPSSVKLTFNRSTGLVSGSFKFTPEGASKAVTAAYKGVLLPGWGGCSSCSLPGTILRPLVVGSYWYTEKFAYQVETAKGVQTKNVNIVRGGAIGVDELKEED